MRLGGAALCLCVAGTGVVARAEDWGLAPVKVWGSVAYDLRAEKVQQETDRLQQLLTTTVNFSSYIWEPWIAVTSGGVGLSFSDLTDGDAAGRDRFLTGNARVNVFPRSRFPFEAHFDASDSRIGSGVGTASDYRSTEFGFVQRYRPLKSSAQFMAGYDRRDQQTVRSGRFAQELLQLDYSQSVNRHNFSVSSNLSDSRRLDTTEATRYHTLVARHNYAPSASFSVDTVANWVDTGTDIAPTVATSTNRYLQLNTIAFWRSAQRPLTVSASARMFDFESGRTAQLAAHSRQLAANVGATYLLGSHWRFSGGGNLARTDAAGRQSLAASASLGAGFQATTITRGRLDYDRYASADVSANRSDEQPNPPPGFVSALQAGHTLAWTLSRRAGSRLSASAGQSVALQSGVDRDLAQDSGRQATHSAALTWSSSDGGRVSYLRFAASDTRSLGGPKSELQLLNLQMTRTAATSSESSWSGSVTVQASRQQNHWTGLLARQRGFVTTASADLSYQRERVFGVPRLRFVSQLRISQESALQLFPDPRERESHYWDNRIEYRIGKLAARASVRAARVDQQTRLLATFKVIREFGD